MHTRVLGVVDLVLLKQHTGLLNKTSSVECNGEWWRSPCAGGDDTIVNESVRAIECVPASSPRQQWQYMGEKLPAFNNNQWCYLRPNTKRHAHRTCSLPFEIEGSCNTNFDW